MYLKNNKITKLTYVLVFLGGTWKDGERWTWGGNEGVDLSRGLRSLGVRVGMKY